MQTPPPDTAPRARPHIAFLDGVRGLAAVYVVFFHFLAWDTSGLPSALRKGLFVLGQGHSAVSVFIVLSGFSLMLRVAATPDGSLKGGLLDYSRRRALRILPPYYAAFALSCLAVWLTAYLSGAAQPVLAQTFNAPNILTHLALVHNLTPWSLQTNMALWSVATEWQIYFLFPLVLLPVWRKGGNIALVGAGFALGVLPGLTPWGRAMFDACPWYIGLFALGQLAAVVAVRTVRPGGDNSALNRSLLVWAGCLLPVLVLGFARGGHGIGADTILSAYLIQAAKDGATGGLVVCGLLALAPRAGVAGGAARPLALRVLEAPRVRKLADFSYSLYLTHCLILGILITVLPLLHTSPLASFALKAFVGIPVAFGFAWVFYRCFERPFVAAPPARPATVATAGAG